MIALVFAKLSYFILRTCGQAIMILFMGKRFAEQCTPRILPPLLRSEGRS
jgi:hypothetical protein